MQEQQLIEQIIQYYVGCLSVNKTVKQFTPALKKYANPADKPLIPAVYTKLYNKKYDALFAVIEHVFEVSKDRITSKYRHYKDGTMYARHAFNYIAFNELTNNKTTIGKIIGGRDHSTVWHSLNAAKDLLKTDIEFAKNIKTATILFKQLIS